MCITDEIAKAIEQFSARTHSIYALPIPLTSIARYGLADEFAEVRRLWKEGKRDAAPSAISDTSARKIAAFGSAQIGRDFVAKFRAAGVTHPVVFPIGPGATTASVAGNTMRALVGA